MEATPRTWGSAGKRMPRGCCARRRFPPFRTGIRRCGRSYGPRPAGEVSTRLIARFCDVGAASPAALKRAKGARELEYGEWNESPTQENREKDGKEASGGAREERNENGAEGCPFRQKSAQQWRDTALGLSTPPPFT